MNKLTKDQVLTLLKESKEQALKFENPRNYMYVVLLSIIHDTYEFDLNDIKDFYDLPTNLLELLSEEQIMKK